MWAESGPSRLPSQELIARALPGLYFFALGRLRLMEDLLFLSQSRANFSDPFRFGFVHQAVACFYPPTDFLNWSKPDEDWMDFERTRQFEPAFGPKSKTRESRQELGKEISPIYFVTTNMAPTLIMHGDADKLVPIYQAQLFEKKCKEVGAPFKLIVKEGADHGWAGIDKDLALFADWFDEHLRGLKK